MYSLLSKLTFPSTTCATPSDFGGTFAIVPQTIMCSLDGWLFEIEDVA